MFLAGRGKPRKRHALLGFCSGLSLHIQPPRNGSTPLGLLLACGNRSEAIEFFDTFELTHTGIFHPAQGPERASGPFSRFAHLGGSRGCKHGWGPVLSSAVRFYNGRRYRESISMQEKIVNPIDKDL